MKKMIVFSVLVVLILLAAMPQGVSAAPRAFATVTRVYAGSFSVTVEGYLPSAAYRLSAKAAQAGNAVFISLTTTRQPFQGVMITVPFKRTLPALFYKGYTYVYVNGRLRLTVKR